LIFPDAAFGRLSFMTQAHEQSHSFHEVVEFPSHADRTESSEFRKNKRILVKQLDLPCWICGSRDAREVHHLHEWSLWPALDPEKVLDTLHVFDPYGYTHKMGEQPIETPDDIRNLLVLCGSHVVDGVTIPGGHHRGVNLGAHDLTMPTWLSLKSAKKGVDITKAIAHAQGEDQKLRGKQK
jgi:hypothetical protein